MIWCQNTQDVLCSFPVVNTYPFEKNVDNILDTFVRLQFGTKLFIDLYEGNEGNADIMLLIYSSSLSWCFCVILSFVVVVRSVTVSDTDSNSNSGSCSDSVIPAAAL